MLVIVFCVLGWLKAYRYAFIGAGLAVVLKLFMLGGSLATINRNRQKLGLPEMDWVFYAFQSMFGVLLFSALAFLLGYVCNLCVQKIRNTPPYSDGDKTAIEKERGDEA